MNETLIQHPEIQAATALQQLIASRRTTFSFQDRQVPEAVIARAIDAARWAPNHKMTQPWRFVIAGPEMQGKLKAYFVRKLAKKLAARGLSEAEIAERMRSPQPDIPCQVLVYCIRNGEPLRQEEDYAAACCAVQNLMLAAWSEGVASGWKSFDNPEAYALFGLDPEAHKIIGLLQLGYPLKEREGSQRKGLDEIVTVTK